MVAKDSRPWSGASLQGNTSYPERSSGRLTADKDLPFPRDYAILAGLHFTDITTAMSYCKHTHYLWARAVVDGCTASPAKYCPSSLVNRAQMGKLLTNAFTLLLYGP